MMNPMILMSDINVASHYLSVQTTDSYGNEVTLLARPMPIEYVLVQVRVGY